MSDDRIFELTEEIKRRCGTLNPFEIAEALNIMVRGSDEFKTLAGMYTVIKGRRVIILNNNLPEHKSRAVLAHEIGHALLHGELAEGTVMRDFMLYDMSLRPEYEANLFAADLLLGDREIIDLATVYGYTPAQIAAELKTDEALVKIKIDSIKNRKKFN